ncbi:hypothetical protein N7499_005105 [Penicillium canescens]|uniref:Uncharacterized protein n=1 Tax=Penicillium canescens TaxID=5083 RepID=A0AAD6I2H6_PENCN|nr:uncharacterized protein N7446_004397 [Penicillium canescens]KAJ6009497.1 hypothetical protein N7522_004513 [Penicillium canescens]KAJ6027000.1 hypothetical protein N7460_011817 [Penicillium canescens]KAJ6040285.1 hypothetical protein N7444_009190 [Penicillium canescens]KAJ6067360.1 hypothetical protein N7446_004397 [Penicillium canescens]KAJ6085476.1 hypothetical protein N7499_005105 [Penicillium canescens]
MSYKTNYELYSRGSIDSRRSPPPDELLSPLATLYPHVAALQPKYDPSNCTFTGYHHTGYWAAAYTTQPLEDPFMPTRRGSDGLPCRFVSKLRRFLSRDDLKSRRGSRATA